MPRCLRGASGPARKDSEPSEAVPPGVAAFWAKLGQQERRKLLTVDRKALFQRIRSQYCSRCFGLFAMRYDELKGSAALDCPACLEFYSGLVVSSGQLTLEDRILDAPAGPFATFAEARQRERERELQFMTGDICGSGWQKRPGRSTVCALHTSPVPYEAISEYWHGLPDDHRAALFRLREEDFCAELDAHLKYQLRICRDCRGNVLKAFKEQRPGARRGTGQEAQTPLEVCDGHFLLVADGLVSVDCRAEQATGFFELAEEVEERKTCDEAVLGDDQEGLENVKHAETPELAREALCDSVALIYKGQVEVAFREQTAGHNALLLFVHLALGMMEDQLLNAFRELDVQQAEAELLDLVAKEGKRKGKKKGKKAAKGALADAACTCSSAAAAPPCPHCAALQCSPPGSPRAPAHQPAAAAARLASPRPAAALPKPPPKSPKQQGDAELGWEVQTSRRRGPSAARRPAQPPAAAAPGSAAPTAAEPAALADAAGGLSLLEPPPPAAPAAAAAELSGKSAAGQQQQQQPQGANPWQRPLGQCRTSYSVAAMELSSWGPKNAVAWPAGGAGSLPPDASSAWQWGAPQLGPALGAFSLFAASPASPRQRWRAAVKGQPQGEGPPAAYQLFGGQESYPLAPLLGAL